MMLRPLSMKTKSLLLAALLVSFAGCRLGEPGSASFASVKIRQHSPAEIATVTAGVFREDGWTVTGTGLHQMVFEKEGTRGQNYARAGIVRTQAGAQTVVRVRVNISDMGDGSYRLDGQAFVVTDPGDSFFEDEVRLANFRAGPYQDLLDKAADKLK